MLLSMACILSAAKETTQNSLSPVWKNLSQSNVSMKKRVTRNSLIHLIKLASALYSRIRFFIIAVSLFVCFTLFSNALQAQVNRYAVANGNWDLSFTWSASSGGAPGASVPVAGDFVFIGDITPGMAVTIPAGYNAACATLTIGAATNASSSLTFTGATSSLNVSGNVTINRPSTTNTNSLNVNAGTATVGGTVTLAGVAINPDRIAKINITNGTLTISTDLVFITGNTASIFLI